ncbi:MAG TPA: hypothetical protein VLT33_00815 [Labilithrix sp.]|jgi:uncharacterized protein YneF (UPF0154 family)|nr:hypothetical protein [Labilithrix sp.]
MGLPTSEHVIFIPVVLLVGIVIGWILGGKAARQQMADRAKRRQE